MLDFKSIFDTHFFSNHHVHAQAVETRLEAMFPGCECVTFSSFAGLLVSVMDELCDANTELRGVSSREDARERLASLNAFLTASGRAPIRELTVADRAETVAPPEGVWKAGAWLVRDGHVVARMLDASGFRPMLAGAGVIVTPESNLAEKLRWARSSYGRRTSSSVSISANGRFSEFQAIVLQQALAATPTLP